MQKKVTYYFLIGSPEFLLKDEATEEILRERVHAYNYFKKYIDFWVVQSPNFFSSTYIDQKSSIASEIFFDTKSPVVEPKNSFQKDKKLDFETATKLFPKEICAIISTNRSLIYYLKLRMNHVQIGNFNAPSINICTEDISDKVKMLNPLGFEEKKI